MENKSLTRRGFLRKTLATGVAITGLSSFSTPNGFDPKGLPTVVFGKTGVRIPRISIGLGSRFCSVSDEDEAQEILTYALDNGIFYWDTANSYTNSSLGVVSEERIGKVLRRRRNEVFLSTKVAAREPDEAQRQVEASLKRLQTDYLDNLMIHSVTTVEDVDRLSRKGGIIDLVTRLKEEGVTRNIGFSGHSDASAMKLMMDRGDFDDVLFAMNQYGDYSQERQETILPAALDKNLGILLMKVVRPKETVSGITANDLIRFALSIDGPSALVLGMDSLDIVKSNIEILKNFTPMTAAERSAMLSSLSPYFIDKNLEWVQPSYRDGHWG